MTRLRSFTALATLALFLMLGSQSLARRAVSMEEVFTNMPVIVSGVVANVEEVSAPVNEYYLTGQKSAMAVHIDIRHLWKGPQDKTQVIYTWPKGAAPCTGVTIEAGKAYIFWAELDTSQKYILFDFCGGFMPDDAPDAPRIRGLLDQMFASAH